MLRSKSESRVVKDTMVWLENFYLGSGFLSWLLTASSWVYETTRFVEDKKRKTTSALLRRANQNFGRIMVGTFGSEFIKLRITRTVLMQSSLR